MKRCLSVVICISAALSLSALDMSWSLLGGVKYIANTDERNSDPSPIAGTLGVEAQIPLTATNGRIRVSVAPDLSFYYTRYLWADNRALPAALENRTAFVPALHLDIPLVCTVRTGPVILRTGAGLGAVIRWGFRETGVPADEYYHVDKINKYLWASGRFFYPSVQLGVSYPTPQGFEPGFLLKCAFPVANLWAAQNVPFHDSMIITAVFTIRLK